MYNNTVEEVKKTVNLNTSISDEFVEIHLNIAANKMSVLGLQGSNSFLKIIELYFCISSMLYALAAKITPNGVTNVIGIGEQRQTLVSAEDVIKLAKEYELKAYDLIKTNITNLFAI